VNAALPILAAHGDHPSSYLALNGCASHFTAPGIDGLIAYAHAGRRFTIQIGGVCAPGAERERLVDAFLAWTREQGRRVIAVQLQRDDAALFGRRPFSVNQLGSSYSVTLPGFSLKGTRFMKLRNKISRALREGVQVIELGVDAPWSSALDDTLDGIDGVWLRSKGKHAKPLRLLVGDRGSVAAPVADRRVFAATRSGEVLGYISYRRTYGRNAGWMHDLSRRIPDQIPGVLELCNSVAIERMRDEGSRLLHFGFTPFVGLDAANELAQAFSRGVGWVLRALARHGRWIYPAQSQLEYKLKWHPDRIEPEFIAFEGGFSLGGLWSVLRATNSI
jgi:lysylphosphatidylglycerol synthetase-like protein (DUF2156 family)